MDGRERPWSAVQLAFPRLLRQALHEAKSFDIVGSQGREVVFHDSFVVAPLKISTTGCRFLLLTKLLFHDLFVVGPIEAIDPVMIEPRFRLPATRLPRLLRRGPIGASKYGTKSHLSATSTSSALPRLLFVVAPLKHSVRVVIGDRRDSSRSSTTLSSVAPLKHGRAPLFEAATLRELAKPSTTPLVVASLMRSLAHMVTEAGASKPYSRLLRRGPIAEHSASLRMPVGRVVVASHQVLAKKPLRNCCFTKH